MWRFALVGLAACGRIDFDPRSDASTDGTPDACALGPWSPPMRLASVATASTDNGPALHPDGSVIVFTSDRAGGSLEDLWVAFATGPLQFGPATPLAAFNSPANDFGAAWPSANELYYSSAGSGASRLYRASYASGTFGAPELVSELAGIDVLAPTITADGLEMFFSDNTQNRFSRATRTSTTAPWQIQTTTIPQLEMGLSGFPSVSGDGLTLYFESDRSGTTEIYVATRPTRESPFDAPTVFAAIDSTANDDDADIAQDGRTFLFGSTRPGGAGSFDLYASTRTCQ